MTGEFDRDDAWQRYLSEKFLDPFYRLRGWQVERYPPKHFMQKLHVDVTIRHPDGRFYHIDEKIMRGLRKGGPAEKINLETWSCSVPGMERRGWIARDEPNESTILFPCHAEEVSALTPDSWKRVTFLDCVWIPFQPLRRWFWEQGEERWQKFENRQTNHSIARKVPIRAISAAIEGVARFLVREPSIAVCPICCGKGLVRGAEINWKNGVASMNFDTIGPCKACGGRSPSGRLSAGCTAMLGK